MSLRALPIVFINLGGEMLYILDQRLTAQRIPSDKAQKVLNDIISTMLNTQFLEELFQQQAMYSKVALKTAFIKLAHASIMRLNTASMDKLYDLMTMAVKQQLFLCPRPSDLLLITLNHVDAIRAMTKLQPASNNVDILYTLLIKNYNGMNEGEFQSIRYTLLNFFQDCHIRVSIFLKDKSQNPNGKFAVLTTGLVPCGTEIPGAIRLYNSNGELFKIRHFQNGGHYQPALKKLGSIEENGERGTKLGINMYLSNKSESNEEKSAVLTPGSSQSVEEISENPLLAKEELNFLAHLLGNATKTPQKAEFRLHLFDFMAEEDMLDVLHDEKGIGNILEMKASESNEELSKIMGEMNSTPEPDNKKCVNLLDLMDNACI